MASDVIVPEVGEVGMEVVFVRWLKAEGDTVAVGDPLFEVDTEKSVMEVEAYAAGTLIELAVAGGDTIQTRQVIARILAPGEEVVEMVVPTQPDTAPPPPSRPTGTVASSAVPVASSDTPAATKSRQAGVSPRARRVAKKLGVDTAGLTGSGPDGLITESDVRTAAAAGAAAPAGTTDGPPGAADSAERARRATADLTTRSWGSIPHFYLQLEADVERGLSLAKPTALICGSVAQALARHPECNLVWDGERPVSRGDAVDLGLLVDTPAGLLITVITGAQDLDLVDMADAIRAAAARFMSTLEAVLADPSTEGLA